MSSIRRMRRRNRVLLGSLLLLALLAGGFLLLQSNERGGEATALAADASPDGPEGEKEKEKEKEVKVPVELAAARLRDLPSYFNATGTLEALRQVELMSKAQGQVVALKVEEGDRVSRGDVLLELDHREQELLRDEARVRAETAHLELARIEDMAGRGLATDRELEEARQNAEVSSFQYDLAAVRLDERIVRAPFDGQVTHRFVELGQTASVGQALVGVAETTPLEIRLFLPEQIVRQLKIGQPVEVLADVARDLALEGRVHRIAPVVDPSTATVKVTLRVGDLRGAARVGSFVRARITTDVHRDVVSIPRKAIVAEAGASFVFVAEADSVRKIEVALGYSDADDVEVLDGLAEGQQVVVVGQGGLRMGSRIRDLAAPAETTDGGETPESGDGEQVARAEG